MEGYRDRVFLISAAAFNGKRSMVVDMAKNLQGTPPTDFGGGFEHPEKFKHIAIFKVTLPEDFVKRIDPHSRTMAGIYVTQPIPPSHVELVYKGAIDKF
jgi:hypothetical protein